LRIEPAAELVAMADAFVDRTTGRRDALRAQLGERIAVDDDHCFGGLDAYQQLLDSGVDVAILAEAPHFRPIHLAACVDAGVHVFAEKPMAVDAPGVRKVLEAGQQAKRKNLSFVSGFETRYSPSSREVVKRIQDGMIGDITTIHTTYNTGPLWHRGRKPEWTEMEFQLRNWYYFTWLSGDHLVEQHVHYNDLVCWIMGERPPLHAWGYGGRAERTQSKYGDIFDHHAVVYDYADGVRYFAFTRQQRGCYNENSKVVFGTKGKMVSQRGWSMQDADGNKLWEPDQDPRHPELNCFEEMFAAMRAGTPINNSLTMAHSTMNAILGRMATHSGKLVSWDQAISSDVLLAPKEYTMDAQPPVVPDANGNYPVPIPGAGIIDIV
jgi:predicted dehydrogenase